VLAALSLASVALAAGSAANWTVTQQPFYRTFNLSSSGSDIKVLQLLLPRSQFVTSSLSMSGHFDLPTFAALVAFQKGNSARLPGSLPGAFDPPTAALLLALHSADGFVDRGVIPPGYLYKMHIAVRSNRSCETLGTLYAANGTVLHQFIVRTHGQNWNDTDSTPQNQFTGDGATPTGLFTFDLESPAPDPVSYGPYNINRAVSGLEGNALILWPTMVRSGILMHTGEWSGWTPSMPMPNSHGCIHGHPTDIDYVQQVLISIGVAVRNNTFGQYPYPYKPQGLLAIELDESTPCQV